ncbi:unnamed protein product [Ixodes hexagonus]
MSLRQLWMRLTSARDPSPPHNQPYHDTLRHKMIASLLCVHCSESTTSSCHIQDQLLTWNMLMNLVDIELEEVMPGRLELLQAPSPGCLPIPEEKHIGRRELAWLLREHRCIKALTLWHNIDPKFRDMLHCALLVNQGVKKLVFGSYDDEHGAFAVETVLSLVGAVAELEELELECRIEDTALVRQLGAILQRISTLTSVKMRGVGVHPANAECMLRGLKSSPNIAVLSVQDFFLGSSAVLAEFSAFGRNLRVLALRHTPSTGVAGLEDLLELLVPTHQLEELCLEDFALNGRTFELLAEMAVLHGTLRRLEVRCRKNEGTIDGASLAKLVGQNTGLHELVFQDGKVNCLAVFGEALGTNTILTKLSLCLVGTEVHDLKLFLKELACNKSLLPITFTDVAEELVSTLCQLLLEVGLEDRVKFQARFRDPSVFSNALKNCTKLSWIRYEPRSTMQDLPLDAPRELANYNQLTLLTIKLMTQIEYRSATNLALFLSSTKTLAWVELLFPTSAESTHTLLDGFSRNTSLSVLRVAQWTFEAAEFDLLWQVVGHSETLTELYMTGLNWERLRMPQSLPQCLLDNHCLIRAVVVADLQIKTDLFALLKFQLAKVMWRNRVLLRKAAQFVMGSRDECFADAFKKVMGSAALVERVKMSANESKEQAMERVMKSKCFLI